MFRSTLICLATALAALALATTAAATDPAALGDRTRSLQIR